MFPQIAGTVLLKDPPSKELAGQFNEEIDRQLSQLDTQEIARQSLERKAISCLSPFFPVSTVSTMSTMSMKVMVTVTVTVTVMVMVMVMVTRKGGEKRHQNQNLH